jgi:hypothetical protein
VLKRRVTGQLKKRLLQRRASALGEHRAELGQLVQRSDDVLAMRREDVSQRRDNGRIELQGLLLQQVARRSPCCLLEKAAQVPLRRRRHRSVREKNADRTAQCEPRTRKVARTCAAAQQHGLLLHPLPRLLLHLLHLLHLLQLLHLLHLLRQRERRRPAREHC